MKKFLALFMAMLLCLLMLPVSASAAVTEVRTRAELQAAFDNYSVSEIKLMADISYSNGYYSGQTLKLPTNRTDPAGRSVTLDLNGYTISQKVEDRGMSASAIAIRPGATLTVKDSSAAGTGKISACNSAFQLEGTLNLEGGTISIDNPSPYDKNPETGFAYGVWVYTTDDATVAPVFNMTGGAISISDELLAAHSRYNFANAVMDESNVDNAKVSITGGTLNGTVVVTDSTEAEIANGLDVKLYKGKDDNGDSRFVYYVTFMDRDKVYASAACEPGKTLNVYGMQPPTTNPSGQVWDGWYTKDNERIDPGMTINSNIICYARWKDSVKPGGPSGTPAPTKAPSVCLAIYYPNGGQGSMKPQTLSGASAILNPNAYTREGYEFIGWNTAADGSGDFYEDGAKVPTRNSIILYAQWKKIDAPVVTEAPTAVPTAEPTAEPTAVSTAAPTAEPTATPIVTAEPTATPIVTAEPTVTPVVTAEPTAPVVTVPPVVNEVKIAVQPEDQYVVVGQRATFKVEASGEGLSYQWHINRGNGWVKLDNAIGASYTTSVVDLDCDGFEYKCVVSDSHGNSVESEPATLHVSAAPEIPETGDHANPVLWISMALLGLAGLMLIRKKAKA